MKTNFRKSIAMIVCVCFLFTGLVGNYVYAESTTGTSNMKIVQNDDNICKVVGEYDEGTAYAILNKNTNEVTLETVEKSKNKIFGFGKGKSKKYKVKVDKSNSEELSATIVDEETKQEHKLSRSKSKVKAQAPLVIPLAFGVAELIAFLLACAATITIAGVTYYAATTIAEKLRRNKTYNYYAAALDKNKTDVYIAGPYPNDAAAFAAVKAGGSVFAITDAKAEQAARRGGNGTPMWHLAHGSGDGFMNHYHPTMYGVKIEGIHCWY
ncbi:MAG TPA: hypothetical protein PK566_17950 [Pseudobacteroides sp.]|jgi:hypothetical protein|nr:hypothetical protein [Pseudobacteroides sp.]